MTVNKSDETLRKIAFGRGSSPEQIRAASDELQRRSSTNDEELAGLATDVLPDHDEEPTPPTGHATPADAQSPKRSGVRPGVAAIVACGIGVLGTVGYYGAVQRTPPEEPAIQEGIVSSGIAVMGSGTGGNRVIFEVPALKGDPDSSHADHWFDAPQTEQDALPPQLNDIDRSTSRYVGAIGTDASAWIARALNGDYCAVVALDLEGSSSYSCADPTKFAETGIWVTGNENTLFWNPSSVIISTTQP